MEINFQGHTALVTGAGKGIGREIVKRLHSYGAKVYALSKTRELLQTLQQELPDVVPLCVDLSDWTAVKLAIAPLSGKVDLLVNNAGVAICEPFGQITEASIDSVMNVNFKAVINISQILCDGMKTGGGGAVVNISSQAGILALRDHALYGASKAALDMLTKCMALELGPHKIRVNSVCPTVTQTDMAMVGWSDPQKAAQMTSRIPLGRFCEVSEVVDAVVYLLSNRASMINGQMLKVDGGATV